VRCHRAGRGDGGAAFRRRRDAGSGPAGGQVNYPPLDNWDCTAQDEATAGLQSAADELLAEADRLAAEQDGAAAVGADGGGASPVGSGAAGGIGKPSEAQQVCRHLPAQLAGLMESYLRFPLSRIWLRRSQQRAPSAGESQAPAWTPLGVLDSTSSR